MKRPNLDYFEARKMTSQTYGLQLVFSIQNLTGLVMSFLWLQNNIDQAVS